VGQGQGQGAEDWEPDPDEWGEEAREPVVIPPYLPRDVAIFPGEKLGAIDEENRQKGFNPLQVGHHGFSPSVAFQAVDSMPERAVHRVCVACPQDASVCQVCLEAVVARHIPDHAHQGGIMAKAELMKLAEQHGAVMCDTPVGNSHLTCLTCFEQSAEKWNEKRMLACVRNPDRMEALSFVESE